MDVGNRRSPAVDVSGRVPRRNLGQIILGGDTYQLIDTGPWAASDTVGSAVTYQAGNLVTSGGVSYVALPAAGNTGQAPPNGTYWQVFDETFWFLRSDRTWVGGVWVTVGTKGVDGVDALLDANPSPYNVSPYVPFTNGSADPAAPAQFALEPTTKTVIVIGRPTGLSEGDEWFALPVGYRPFQDDPLLSRGDAGFTISFWTVQAADGAVIFDGAVTLGADGGSP